MVKEPRYLDVVEYKRDRPYLGMEKTSLFKGPRYGGFSSKNPFLFFSPYLSIPRLSHTPRRGERPGRVGMEKRGRLKRFHQMDTNIGF